MASSVRVVADKDGAGCLYVILMPLAVVLIAGGDGNWIVAGLAAAAVVIMLIVTIGELLPQRWRRR